MTATGALTEGDAGHRLSSVTAGRPHAAPSQGLASPRGTGADAEGRGPWGRLPPATAALMGLGA